MFNKSILIGRLAQSPELKSTQNSVYVTSITVACDRRFSKDKQADFINIVAWRQQAEFICKYFGKGDPIGIEGSIQTRSYEDKNGNKRTAVEVVADNVFFVGGKGQGQGSGSALQTHPAALTSDYEEVETDDDLPF